MTSCHQVGLGMFTGMDMFPLSGGDISWNDKQEQAAILAQLEQWRAYDDMLSEGRSQIVWPVLLQMAFPFMTGWPLVKMLMALILKSRQNRRLGRAFAQYIEFACGTGNLSKAAIHCRLHGLSFAHDCLSPVRLSFFAGPCP